MVGLPDMLFSLPDWAWLLITPNSSSVKWQAQVFFQCFFQCYSEARTQLAFLGRIEINGTFYSLQTVESFANWAAETPDIYSDNDAKVRAPGDALALIRQISRIKT